MSAWQSPVCGVISAWRRWRGEPAAARADGFGRVTGSVSSGQELVPASHLPIFLFLVISIATAKLLAQSKRKQIRQTLPFWLTQQLRKEARPDKHYIDFRRSRCPVCRQHNLPDTQVMLAVKAGNLPNTSA
ncbi:hypothetical protein MIND_01420300 [Mycena indigotica]|uniref:Uncharacterized protein n=1 Tax=Mycena indigotica TaxID=2126181 RepID=A0A8H6VPD5_9AGAR|nr:uncharacterized protein MIND_01420300 [Mycena indigotica]KAF7288749.1 hypothetical protein MIND_01420300 [Mycena indigotica]